LPYPFAVVNVPFHEVELFIKSHPDMFFSVGIHPWEVHNTDSSALETLEKMLVNEKFKAIGECGFDRNAKAAFKEQGYFFERQILLSEKYEKPLIIHCVAAFNELILLRKRFAATQSWIVHGFRGKPEMAQQLLRHAFALSFGKKFTKKRALEVKVTMFDILNQNDNQNRYITDTYIEDSDSNTFQRSFLMTMTYNFRSYN